MTRRDPQSDPRGFLADELTRARLAAGFKSQEMLADKLGFDRSVIGKAETGERVPSPDVLRAWCEACDLDPDLFGRFATLASLSEGAPIPAWFEEWLEAERVAQVLRYWQPIIIPGILQTSGYARELLLKVQTDTSPEAIDAKVAAKMARREIFERPEPPDVTVVLDEIVLRRLIGSAEIMADQLRFVGELAARPYITVQVVPRANGANAGLGGPVNLASVDGVPDVLHTDAVPEGQTHERRALVRKAGVAFDHVRGDALSRGQSAELIAKVAQEWNTQAD